MSTLSAICEGLLAVLFLLSVVLGYLYARLVVTLAFWEWMGWFGASEQQPSAATPEVAEEVAWERESECSSSEN